MNWISVKDQLPVCGRIIEDREDGTRIDVTRGEHIIAFYKDENEKDCIDVVMFLDKKIWMTRDKMGNVIHVNPTHWMPLPKGPEDAM